MAPIKTHLAQPSKRGLAARFVRWLTTANKSVVLERVGDAIRFNPEFLAFAKHYRFEPRPVAVARGNEKGRVERQIDFVRKSFFAAREFTDVADLNAQARQWCEGRAFDRPWPEDDALTVRQAFALEQPRLLGLPGAGYALGQRLDVPVAKTPRARRGPFVAHCAST